MEPEISPYRIPNNMTSSIFFFIPSVISRDKKRASFFRDEKKQHRQQALAALLGALRWYAHLGLCQNPGPTKGFGFLGGHQGQMGSTAPRLCREHPEKS